MSVDCSIDSRLFFRNMEPLQVENQELELFCKVLISAKREKQEAMLLESKEPKNEPEDGGISVPGGTKGAFRLSSESSLKPNRSWSISNSSSNHNTAAGHSRR